MKNQPRYEIVIEDTLTGKEARSLGRFTAEELEKEINIDLPYGLKVISFRKVAKGKVGKAKC